MIDSSRVSELFESVYIEDEHSEKGILVEDAIKPVRIDVEALGEHRAEVAEMLAQLPHQFHANGVERPDGQGGGGWSFLNACVCIDPDRPDLPFEQLPQWTGLHMVVNQLLTMGAALGLAKPVLPRSMWLAMPGGMPYYVVNDLTEALA